jgi:hypothetical protein
MSQRLGRVLPWVALVACLTGCQPAASQSPLQITRSSEAYVHRASGMVFPSSVGEFRKISSDRFDAEGLDVSAGYDLAAPGLEIVATVYVYPAPRLVSIGSPPAVIESARETLCRQEYANRKQEVFDFHPGARLVREASAAPPQGGPLPGAMAAFSFDDTLAGERRALGSELYVFCYAGDRWAFEYRFTYPEEQDAGPTIRAFMTALRWPVFGGSP